MGLIDKVKAAAKNADSKAGEKIDVSRVKSKIAEEKKAIDELYKNIGTTFYENKDKADPTKGLKTMCKEIDKHKATIAELEAEIVSIEEAGKKEREQNNADAEAAAKAKAEAKAEAKAAKAEAKAKADAEAKAKAEEKSKE